MKLLKNLGWFLLAVLSFFFGYGFIQGLATTSLALGASPYAVTLLYVALAGVYVYGIYNGIRKVLFVLRRVVSTDLFGFLPWFGSYLWLSSFSCQMILQ